MTKWGRLGADARRPRCAAACLWLCAAAQAAGAPPAAPPVSLIQVPLELDLTPLFEAAESALPARAGHWPHWRDWHGVDARYRAWRGPLSLTLQGDVLHAQAHVRYQLQARTQLLGSLGFDAGCGVDEPPRQAVVGALARLDWAPDWSLYPRFRILPTRPLDRCEVTVADIDVSPLVGQVFEDRMEASLREAVRALAPRLQSLRGEAERAWRAMQTPRELTPGLWLHLQPLGLALAPPQGAGSRVRTAVWLAFRAAISGEAGATAAPTPLPPLMPYRPGRPGLRFNLGLELDYPRVSAALSKRLAGTAVALEGRSARLAGLGVSGERDDLVLAAELTGDLAGRLTIMARPAFDAATQTLALREVDFVFEAADPNEGLMIDLFYERIRDHIEAEVNGLLAERTAGLAAALGAVLAAGLPPELAPDLSGLRIAELQIRVGDTGLALAGAAGGSLRLGTNGGAAAP